MKDQNDEMQILPNTFGMKLIRRDSPELAAAHIHLSTPADVDSATYSPAPALARLANDLSKVDQVRSERVAAAEQRLRAGVYDTPSAATDTAQVMLDEFTAPVTSRV